MRRPALGTILALLLALGAARARAGEADAREALSPGAVREHLEKLTSDDFAGRGAGEAGGRKASEWLASELKRLGLEPAGDDGTYFQSFAAGKKTLRNVIATLGGTASPEEVVVIGAHYDHLGEGHLSGMLDPLSGRGKIHYGADDNASGTAGVLSLARAFALSGEKPRRRVVFILFDGEEAGLLGSRHYVRAPSFPLERTVAMLNMDMIGRPRGKLTVYGANTGSGFDALVGEAGKASDLELVIKDSMPPNSDHDSFYKRKIPSIALFTGLHKDYHRATDTAEKIDYEGEAKVLRVAYAIALGLARGEERPVFAKAKDGTLESMIEQMQALLDDDDLLKPFGGRKNVERIIERLTRRKKDQDEGRAPAEPPAARRPDGRPRLGVQVDPEGSDEGVSVQTVSEGSIAEKAGVMDGDVIVEMGGAKIATFDDLRAAVGKAHGATKLVVLRNGQRIELDAEFPAEEKKPVKKWL